jgi:hypothetical protein
MTLMPPTKACSPSTTQQLLVQAAQLAGLQPVPPAVERAEHRQRHAAAGQTLAPRQGMAWRLNRSRRPPRARARRAAPLRASCSATARCTASVWKM